MRFHVLATDYDGTLASDGTVEPAALESLQRLRESGRKVVLVTGRQLSDLQRVCPRLDVFERIVAENGGVLYRPESDERRLLAPKLLPELVQSLRRRGVTYIEEGTTLVATVRPFETAALEAIRDLGLELKLVFNKDAVMILSAGISKASGPTAALGELGLSPHSVVGVGDAENDHALLGLCECSVAVANALPMVKKRTDITTRRGSGRGVMELVDELLKDDLKSRGSTLTRHHLVLGRTLGGDGRDEKFSPFGTVALIAGSSGGGKTTATLRLMERLVESKYQFCAFDPEGDYDTIEDAVILGGAHHPPAVDEVLQLLREPRQNAIVNLLRVPMHERPRFCASLLVRLQELRVRTGRPHWLVFDEAHHLFPADWDPAQVFLPEQLETALLITVHPNQVSTAILKHVNLMLAVGDTPRETVGEMAAIRGAPSPRHIPERLEKRQAAVWRLDNRREPPLAIVMERSRTEHRRHIRKYAEGLLIPERCFYFRGPEGKLNLRAHNLIAFLDLADGVDDDTWLFHLRQGDYSRWFKEVIGDDDLADEAKRIEGERHLSARESRQRMHDTVMSRYTLPENPALPIPD